MNKITFSNKTHGKLDFTMADLIAWKAYMSDDKPQQPSQKVPEIINLHPQTDVEVLKKGRGRPKKIIFQPAIIIPVASQLARMQPEPEPEPIHQHPAPEPVPELKRKVGRPRKIIQVNHHHCSA